jgi:UDP-glucose 4-epimerase
LVFTASTSEVYGKNTNFPFHEDADLVLGPTTKGRWSYAASKALDEFLALSYWKEKGLPVVIARLFNTVGPRQTGRYGMVLPNFVGQALEGAPITVYGTGQQSRCFCDVRDAVEALLRLIATDKSVGEVVNIGNNHEITIEALAQLVKEKTGSSSPIQHIPYDQAYEPGFEDMFRRVPCLDKLERLTGFRPTTPLPEIIDRVAAYHGRKKQFVAVPRETADSAVRS